LRDVYGTAEAVPFVEGGFPMQLQDLVPGPGAVALE
jgi:hypothetical protein